VPGYAIIYDVEAIGPAVTCAAVGDRVGAPIILGGYAEYIYLDETDLIDVPGTLDPAETVAVLAACRRALQGALLGYRSCAFLLKSAGMKTQIVFSPTSC
jgi:NADPH:quinone reductase-like Zn-dependent oxidoreductase